MSREEKSEFIFTWRIKNYSACYQTKGEFIESPGFEVESLRGSRWNLRFFPKGVSKLEVNESVSCYLKWEQFGGISKNPSIEFSLEILVGLHVVLKYFESKHRFTKKEFDWGWKSFMNIDELAEKMNSWSEDVITIRCRITFDKVKKQILSGLEACTIIDVNRRFFEWNVTAPLEHSESLVFPISDVYSIEITLASLSEGLKILLRLKEHDENLSQPIMFQMTFSNKKGRKIVSKHAKYFEDKENWEFPDFISKNDLEYCRSNSSNYKFKLECEIYFSKKQIMFNGIEKLHFNSTDFAFVESEPQASPVTAMQNDFRNLFENKKYFDVTIKAGCEEFPAHKLVLRARSPVFEAMFDQNMLESETGVVNVTDIDGETMKTFLQFLYTETVDKMDYESAKKLLLAADKYQVPSLAKECVSFLISVLSIENACDIISISDFVNCEGLRSCALDFIVSNAAEILIAPDWRPWIRENIELATDIFSKLSTDFVTKYK